MKRLLILGFLLIILVGALNAQYVVSGYMRVAGYCNAQDYSRALPYSPIYTKPTGPCRNKLVEVEIYMYSGTAYRFSFDRGTDSNGFYYVTEVDAAAGTCYGNDLVSFRRNVAEIIVTHAGIEESITITNGQYTGNYIVSFTH